MNNHWYKLLSLLLNIVNQNINYLQFDVILFNIRSFY
jgi:hypothetical protein